MAMASPIVADVPAPSIASFPIVIEDADEDDEEPHSREPSADQPAAALGGSAGFEQAPRGIKRGRRDRGSTAKERISKMPPCAAGKRSSIYRGVTRHRWTGRYEAHLWDKSTWNQTQNKKGKQVYLGAYDDEEAAARAYDLAALKYWGPGTVINFPVSDYSRDVEEMQTISREEYLASLRRKSSGFSRGISKLKGASRHHSNARWETQMGRGYTSNLPQLGAYGTLLDGGAGSSLLGCVTNINLCNFITWLQPGGSQETAEATVPLHKSVMEEEHSSEETNVQPWLDEDNSETAQQQQEQPGGRLWQCCEPYQFPKLGLYRGGGKEESSSSTTALSALLQSPMFIRMQERVAAEAAAKENDAAGAAIANCPPCSSPSVGEQQASDGNCTQACESLALSLPPFACSQAAGAATGYLPCQEASLWNPFEPFVPLPPLLTKQITQLT